MSRWSRSKKFSLQLCNFATLLHCSIATLLICNFYLCRTDQLDGPTERTNWTDQLDGPVFSIWSLDQFAFSKIDLSVCTLSQLQSPTKALLRNNQKDYECSYFFMTIFLTKMCFRHKIFGEIIIILESQFSKYAIFKSLIYS